MLIKENSILWKIGHCRVMAQTPRCPRVEFRLLLFFPCLNCDHCFMNEKWLTLCVSEPSCAVHHFVSGVSASVGLFSMTSILESVKLLKRESIHGSGLEFFAICVCFMFLCFKLYFYPLLHFFHCLLLFMLIIISPSLSWSNVNGGLQ